VHVGYVAFPKSELDLLGGRGGYINTASDVSRFIPFMVHAVVTFTSMRFRSCNQQTSLIRCRDQS